VQLVSSARAKIEQLQSIPYMQVGMQANAGATGGPAYFVFDPIYEPKFDPAKGDVLLSDTVTLRDGTVVTRTVDVQAIDDPADGVGAADADDVEDPNTDAVMDYKLVTVTGTLNKNGINYSQVLTTILKGTLPGETEGATGQDSDGSDPVKPKKAKKTPPAPPPPDDGCASGAVPKGKKKPGKKGGC
jgi:hypothetical protein